MQWRRSPTARCASIAVTVESTPPETPQTTPPSPTCSRIAATARSAWDRGDHPPAIPQMSSAKLRNRFAPVFRVDDFRVELEGVEPGLLVLESRDAGRLGAGGAPEALGQGLHAVPVARPHPELLRNALEQPARAVAAEGRGPVGAAGRRPHLAAAVPAINCIP